MVITEKLPPWSHPRSLKRARIPQHSLQGPHVNSGPKPSRLPGFLVSKGGLLPHDHGARVCGYMTIHSCPQQSMAFQKRCGSKSATSILVTSRGLGPLGWNTVVGLCGRSSELVLHGLAAGVLGCWSDRGQLCGHFPASGSRVAVHTVALPTDGVAVSPTPTITAQGTARPKAASSAI